jgi:hypothetical protein
MPLLTPLDPDLTLTRTQYPAIVCNQEKTEPFTFRGSVNRRVANVTTVGQEAIHRSESCQVRKVASLLTEALMPESLTSATTTERILVERLWVSGSNLLVGSLIFPRFAG